MHESDRRKEYEEEIKKLKLEIKEVRERYYQNSLSLWQTRQGYEQPKFCCVLDLF